MSYMIKYHEDNDIVINKSNIILMIKRRHTNPIKKYNYYT
jgi:hypothetical protein